MKKYMTLLRKLFVKKSVCERCKGSGDLLLFCGIIEDCPRCDGSGNKKD